MAARLDALGEALHLAGAAVTPVDAHTLRSDAEPELVGSVALAARVPLLELRAADGAGLEEMFLHLTSDSAREGAAA